MMTYRYKCAAILAAFALVLSSCGKDSIDNPYDHVSAISVTAAELTFPEEGGEGSITVACDKDYEVACAASWLTITKEGNTVSLKAEFNRTITERVASITLSCGSDSVKVTAQQMAYRFVKTIPDNLDLNDDEAEFEYTYRAPYDVTVKTTGSWLDARMDGDKLKVTLPPNNSGVARLGTIYLSGGTEDFALTDSIAVSQYDFANKIAGNYNMKYYSRDWTDDGGYEKMEHNETVVISRDESTSEVSMALANGFSIPLVFSAKDMTLTLKSMAYCGTEKSGSTTLYIYTTLVDTNHHMMIFGEDFAMVAPIVTVEINGKSTTYLKFYDNGVWGRYYEGFAADSFYLYRFTSTCSFSNVAGGLAEYITPELTRL